MADAIRLRVVVSPEGLLAFVPQLPVVDRLFGIARRDAAHLFAVVHPFSVRFPEVWGYKVGSGRGVGVDHHASADALRHETAVCHLFGEDVNLLFAMLLRREVYVVLDCHHLNDVPAPSGSLLARLALMEFRHLPLLVEGAWFRQASDVVAKVFHRDREVWSGVAMASHQVPALVLEAAAFRRGQEVLVLEVTVCHQDQALGVTAYHQDQGEVLAVAVDRPDQDAVSVIKACHRNQTSGWEVFH